MRFVLDDLEANIGEVVSAAAAYTNNAWYGFVPYVDNHAFDVTGDLEGGLVHSSAASLSQAFAFFERNYTTPNRNPGDGLSGPDTQNPICEENALDALYAAATEFPWRPGATHVVVVATDDTFLTPPDNYGDRDNDGRTDQTDFPREGDYPANWGYQAAVEALQAEQVRVFSFTRLAPPSLFTPGRCGTGRRLPWASISDGWSTPYAGAAPIPAQTFGRNFDLDRVRRGQLSLSATINEVVFDSYCKPFQ